MHGSSLLVLPKKDVENRDSSSFSDQHWTLEVPLRLCDRVIEMCMYKYGVIVNYRGRDAIIVSPDIGRVVAPSTLSDGNRLLYTIGTAVAFHATIVNQRGRDDARIADIIKRYEPKVFDVSLIKFFLNCLC